MFTADDLTRLAKACGAKPNASVVSGIVQHQKWLSDGGINTAGRVAEFLAQACLETDYFKTLREYASGKAYEGRKDLGNVVAGDGVKFKGRGIFQCTGRDNYSRYGKRLGVDLLKEPALAERPDISVRIAVMYWNDKGLNAYADKGDTKAISRAINRGNPKATKAANHEADRIKIAHLARDIIKDAPDRAVIERITAPESTPERSASNLAQTVAIAKTSVVSPPPSASPPPAVIVRDEPTKPPGFWSSLAVVLLSAFKGKR